MMNDECLIEFKEICHNYITNQKKLIYINDFWSTLQDPTIAITLLISCYHDFFGYKSITTEVRLIQLYNFLYILDRVIESNELINVVLIRFWRKTFYHHIDFFNQYDKLMTLINKINHAICSSCHLINDIKKTQSQNNIKCFRDFPIIDNDSISVESALSEPVSSKNIFEPIHKSKEKTITNTNTTIKKVNTIDCKSKLELTMTNSNPMYIKKSDMLLSSYANDIVSFDDEDEIENSNVIYKSNGKPFLGIKFITIDLLLKKIAISNYYSLNEKLINSLIDQCHCFTSVSALIQKIMIAYHHYTHPSSIDLLLLLKQLIVRKHQSDIKRDLHLIEQLNSFYNSIRSSDTVQSQSKQDLKLEELINEPLSIISNNNFSNTILRSNCLSEQLLSFDIIESNTSEIALQLTSITTILISKIIPTDFLYSSENREVKAPHLFKLIQRSNLLTLFIIEDICSYDYKKQRSKAIEKYISIANELKQVNNFNDLLIIISALNHMIIQYLLIDTWNHVSTKSKALLTELTQFVSFEELYKNIRNTINDLKQEHCSFTPYVGITLKKLSFLNEGNQYVKNKKLINLEKIELVTQVINEFKEYMTYLSKTTYNSRLQLLDHINPKTEKELIILAKLIEPTFCLMKRKSKTKRITNSEAMIKGQSYTRD